MDDLNFNHMPITKAVYGQRSTPRDTRPPIHRGSSLASILGKEKVRMVRQSLKAANA